MSRKMLWSGVALIWATTAATAVAQWVEDHTVTRAEMETQVQERFGRLDVDRDGYVTRQELLPFRAERLQGNVQERFDRRDANHDGVLSREEFAAGAPVGREGLRGRGMHGGGLPLRLFGLVDADRDGRVSLPEAQGFARAAFDRADTDRDGRVTPLERRAAMAQWRGGAVPSSGAN